MKKLLIAGFILIFAFNSCYKPPPSESISNQPPETYISNIMISDSLGDTAVADTSESPYVSIYIYGYDVDGKIISFQWAIDDTLIDTTIQWAINDTLIDTTIYVNAWHSDSIGEADGEKAIITFPATDTSTFYQHIFYVRAVDDDSTPDPTPAILKLFVKNNYLPHPTVAPIIYEAGVNWVELPKDTQDIYMLDDTTSYWKGISFKWGAIDSDAVSPIMYSYRWDTLPFSDWTYDTTKMFITGRSDPILTNDDTLHRFQIIARDDALAVSSDTAEVYIKTYKKTFNNEVLLVDGANTIEVPPDTITDADMDNFYKVLMDTVTYDNWDNSDGSNPLTMEALAPYSTVVFYRDAHQNGGTQLFDSSAVIFKFLNAGGNLVLMGDFIYSDGIDISPERDTIYKKYYFGIRNYIHAPTSGDLYDFIRGLAIYDPNIYPAVEYDPTKFSHWDPGMKGVDVFDKLTSHSTGIYGFDSYSLDPEFQGKPCAVQNTCPDTTSDGRGFRVVFFNFSFYFMKTDAAGEPLKTVMQNAIKFVRGVSQ